MFLGANSPRLHPAHFAINLKEKISQAHLVSANRLFTDSHTGTAMRTRDQHYSLSDHNIMGLSEFPVITGHLTPAINSRQV